MTPGVTPIQGVLAIISAMSFGLCLYIVRELWVARRMFPVTGDGTVSFILGAWTYANVALYTILSVANLVSAQYVTSPYDLTDWLEILVIVSTYLCVMTVGRGIFTLTRRIEADQKEATK